MSESKQYYEPLTWLRGLAALFVVISHTLRATEVTYSGSDEAFQNSWISFLDLGTFGVLLFFTLSGTTLYISNVKEGRSIPLLGFYLKRFFRIWPAFLGSFILYIAFAFFFSEFYGSERGLWIEKQFLAEYDLRDIVSYLTLSFNIWGQGGLFNNAYWSLPVEFQYYLLFPLVILLFRYLGPFSPILMGALLYLAFKYKFHFFHDARFFMLAFTFCGGIFIGYLFKMQYLKVAGKWLGGMVFLLSLALGGLINAEVIEFGDMPLLSNLWISLGLSALLSVFLLAFFDVGLPRPLLKTCMDLGNKSYSIYLYHNLLIGVAVLLLIHFQVEQAWARFGLVFLFAAPITYLLATLSYRYIELPFISVGRRLSKRNESTGR